MTDIPPPPPPSANEPVANSWPTANAEYVPAPVAPKHKTSATGKVIAAVLIGFAVCVFLWVGNVYRVAGNNIGRNFSSGRSTEQKFSDIGNEINNAGESTTTRTLVLIPPTQFDPDNNAIIKEVTPKATQVDGGDLRATVDKIAYQANGNMVVTVSVLNPSATQINFDSYNRQLWFSKTK